MTLSSIYQTPPGAIIACGGQTGLKVFQIEFYVQCAIKFVHEHENFRQKSLKGNGTGRIREGKERDPPGYFVISLSLIANA